MGPGGGDPPNPDPDPEPRVFATTIIEPPCAREKGAFGFATTELDFDGDGTLDLGIGAPGEGAVHIAIGNGDGTFQSPLLSFDKSGPLACPYDSDDNRLGESVTAGDLDGDGDDELISGAPWTDLQGFEDVGAVYIFGLAGQPGPVQLRSSTATSFFGAEVLMSDLDQDGFLDLAVGAPKAEINGDIAGRVHLFNALAQPQQSEVLLDNPAPVPNGNLGWHMAIDDVDGDGFDELFVTAVGNTTTGGVQFGGQVYGYWGPPQPGMHFFVEDAGAMPLDNARYGMFLAARNGQLLIGAPRRNVGALSDTGLGFLYEGPSFTNGQQFVHPTAKDFDLFGYRVELGDVIGDETQDVLVLSLPSPSLAVPNERAMFIYDGADLSAEPKRIVPLEDSGSHFAVGLSLAQHVLGGQEEIVMGDSRFDRTSQGDEDSGRVVLYY